MQGIPIKWPEYVPDILYRGVVHLLKQSDRLNLSGQADISQDSLECLHRGQYLIHGTDDVFALGSLQDFLLAGGNYRLSKPGLNFRHAQHHRTVDQFLIE